MLGLWYKQFYKHSSSKTFATLYKSLVRLRLEYASLVWNHVATYIYSGIMLLGTFTLSIIAEHLSMRQLILHRISCSVIMYVCMYVSHLTMQFVWRAGYPACADCGPFVIHLSGMDNEDDEEHLLTSDLAVEATMTLALREMAVTRQCIIAFGEGPDSWLGSETSSNLGSNFCHFAIIIRFFERCCGARKRHAACWAGPQMYDLMIVSVCAQGLLYVFILLVLYGAIICDLL